ncbi:MAG TPA: aminotransferase class I/II-fold pyridoxal phosphate-dependent enzyme [Trueperaceae bacterium]
MAHQLSARIEATLAAMAPFTRFFNDSAWSRRDPADPGNCDFVFGNPHEMPLPGFVSALQRHVEPRDRNWFAYKDNHPASRRIIADALNRRRGTSYRANDIFVTNGAFAAISVSLATLIDQGDEVIFMSPPWFFYESMIVNNGGTAVRVRVAERTLDLDLRAIEAAISERTQAIIVNSPNNPTGRIYPPETLERLSRILSAASERNGRPIYLLSDESYSRIIFGDRHFPSPAAYYAYSLVLYTYGKTLLTPGQRIGYIALSPEMPDPERLREAIMATQFVTGFAFPNALMQHSLADLEELTIDMDHLKRKRDLMVNELSSMGYSLALPEGTFYLLVESPLEDDLAFCDELARHGVYVLPGAIFEMPGYFRISLTASDEMIERSLPGFRAAIRRKGVKANA